MLASINVNQSVYIKPNAKTWEILKKYHAQWNDEVNLEQRIKVYKDNLKSVNVNNKVIQLLELSVWNFMNIFGEYMTPLSNGDGPMFMDNQAYFDLDDLDPIFREDQIPVLPEPTQLKLSPKSSLAIPTNFSDGDTVRAKLAGDVLACWGSSEQPGLFYPGNEIIEDERDYLIHDGLNAIVLHNTYDKPTSCSISFAPYKKDT